MQNKELTVISSEIRKGSPNLRTRRTQSLKGGIITFVTSCEVFELVNFHHRRTGNSRL